MTKHYILDGTTPVQVDLLTWAQWYETADRHVADTWVTPTMRVSSVFLGLDHQFGNGPPLLFETMVFHDGDGQECERYSTWADAEKGHEAMVDAMRTTLTHKATP